MKKNISINIGGIIFHIEEEGYDSLKSYLDSINKYFSTYEDSSEIIADIENRIAEIFLAKLNEGKQVINSEDVSSLISTMGSIQDFEALEETLDDGTFREEFSHKKQATYDEPSHATRKLFRDMNGRLIGGVCSGLAHYFNVDALWIRLLFLILTFGGFIFEPAPVLVIIGYIAMWIIVPPNYTLEENQQIKKLYRNPDDKVIAGVAGGIAAYFGTDTTLIRVLFILGIFAGGTGLILYLVLWIITPIAATITEKVQMRGEPVTLSNIESNIKKGLNLKEDDQENLLVKILLFPFRLIAMFFQWLSRVLGPLLKFIVEAIRVIIGVFITFVGLAVAVSTIIGLAAVLGITAAPDNMVIDGVPISIFTEMVPTIGVLGAFLIVIIPAVMLAIAGISIISRRWVLNTGVGWSFLAAWFISIAVVAATIPKTINNWSDEGYVETEEIFNNVQGKQLVLRLSDIYEDDNNLFSRDINDYNEIRLQLRGHDEDYVKVVKKISARGSSFENARNYAEKVSYDVVQDDSTIVFDREIKFDKEASWRAQEVTVTLYIPYQTPVHVESGFNSIISRTLSKYGFSRSDFSNNTWVFNPEGLQCMTCSSEYDSKYSYEYDYNGRDGEIIEFDSISSLVIDEAFNVKINQGEKYSVKLSSHSERYVEKVNLTNIDGTLTLDFDNDGNSWSDESDEVYIEISVPEIQSIKSTGKSKIYINNLRQENLEIDASNQAKVNFSGDINNLFITATGISRIDLEGNCKFMQTKISGSSSLNAKQLRTDRAEVTVSGAARAKVNVIDELIENTSQYGSIENIGQYNK
ncbi:PspC domain-containing protein [Marinigracilibium pacificum]|uniref:PspC domain-containing protein n=1 Tax=Marinigracilibium pacificum TaxID=2729599 RepID=A0A848J206_9BACT|nr:PspC domain-containing protein [Marinigracilibium pacificum]NMM49368.1 PspC domain-containing protein [Marinigracilibium pacificum]